MKKISKRILNDAHLIFISHAEELGRGITKKRGLEIVRRILTIGFETAESKKWLHLYRRLYRKENTNYRNRARKANYDRTKIIEKARRRPTGVPHRPWEEFEDKAILEMDMPKPKKHKIWFPATDRELSGLMSRSVRAIQQRRYVLKNSI